jgi:hypothetical protein
VTDWIRSSFCEATNCVEVKDIGTTVLLRDTVVPEAFVIIGQRDWADFIQGVKAGEFDLPELHG